ncbi:GNAT family N-acetyltransferase [Pedobacter sp. KLB.chiD]|uniref:GNAT family N-acetyltransferase n=1 Tax=Pedobacter sp. KLB.chiD TaxID=3387402 RepID=UPI003999D4C7
MIVREATHEDLETLRRFEQGVISAERPFDVTMKEEKITYYDLPGLISSSAAALMVVEDKKRLLGSGYVLIKPAEKSYNLFKEYAYIGFMYVVPEERGRGVNKLILDALISWAKSKSIVEIRLEVYAENASAVKAYEKAGFKPLLTTMRLEC